VEVAAVELVVVAELVVFKLVQHRLFLLLYTLLLLVAVAQDLQLQVILMQQMDQAQFFLAG
jgi:hypothetical protein